MSKWIVILLLVVVGLGLLGVVIDVAKGLAAFALVALVAITAWHFFHGHRRAQR